MTDKILDWLNQNRFRAYPLVNDEGLVCDGKRVPDCVVLDCLVMDTRRGKDSAELVFTGIDVESDATTVRFTYDGEQYSYAIQASGSSSPDDMSVVCVDGSAAGVSSGMLYMKLVFSTHEYILKQAGTGSWRFSGKALPSKVVRVAASGVSGVSAAGSAGVDGYEEPGTASGEVHLVDGYRTQPVVHNGEVLVKVGTQYGYDPCHVAPDPGDGVATNCDELMFFFCGQNAIDSGNVELEGGPGVTVKQGGKYTSARDILDGRGNVGIAAGESVPCIEVVASSDLMGIYRPSVEHQVDS